MARLETRKQIINSEIPTSVSDCQWVTNRGFKPKGSISFYGRKSFNIVEIKIQDLPKKGPEHWRDVGDRNFMQYILYTGYFYFLNTDRPVTLKDLIPGTKFCIIFDENVLDEKSVISKLENGLWRLFSEIVSKIETNNVIFETSPTHIIINHDAYSKLPTNRIVDILSQWFTVKIIPGSGVRSKLIVSPRIVDLFQKGPERIQTDVKNMEYGAMLNPSLKYLDHYLIIKSNQGRNFYFLKKLIREVSEYLAIFLTTKVGNNNEIKTLASIYSDAVLTYFQRFITQQKYDPDQYYNEILPWIPKSFSIDVIADLFEFMDQYRITDQMFGIELLKIIYYFADDIENYAALIIAVKEIPVPNDWIIYRRILSVM